MNVDEQLRRELSEMLDATDAPHGDVGVAMERGRVFRRRQNRIAVSMVAASAVLILGVGVVAQQVTADDDEGPDQPIPAEIPRAPEGMRLVGMKGRKSSATLSASPFSKCRSTRRARTASARHVCNRSRTSFRCRCRSSSTARRACRVKRLKPEPRRPRRLTCPISWRPPTAWP